MGSALRIGITCDDQTVGEERFFRVAPAYAEAIRRVGGLPLLLAPPVGMKRQVMPQSQAGGSSRTTRGRSREGPSPEPARPLAELGDPGSRRAAAGGVRVWTG